MYNTDFFYPQMMVNIGKYSFDAGIELDVYSSKEQYFDWSNIRFTGKMVEAMAFKKMDQVKIELGYNDEYKSIFSGYVKNSVNVDMASQNEILCKDEMMKLEETKITETFLDADPQEIIAYGLQKAGIEDYQLSSKSFSKKKVVVISKRNVIHLIKEVHNLWDIEENFFFDSNGRFYWGRNKEQDKIYEFQHGENIINLTFENGSWVLETISIPFVEHSHVIRVNHPQITGEFEVYKMHFAINVQGFPRTKIYFRGE